MNRHAAQVARSAADFLPKELTLTSLRDAASTCKGCELYKQATQTVFGEGPPGAKIMLVGEIPGDVEDRAGRPFVGPAGRLLGKICESVGLDRQDLYVTNAVKHFKWEERGKKRLHKKPNRTEVVSCRAWLESEILVVDPRVVVCLGATAAQALLGNDFRVTRQRGELIRNAAGPWLMATWHPSAILRAPSSEARETMRRELTQDLQTAASQALP